MTKNTISNVRMRQKRVEQQSNKPVQQSNKPVSSKSYAASTHHSTTRTHVHADSSLYAPDLKCWAPPPLTLFQILVSVRMSAAIWSPISDCDEVYNYWEPLHLLLYGRGFQTWEYSPTYALRSYLNIWLHALPVKPFHLLLPNTKITSFFFLRCFLGFFCALSELYLYTSIRHRFGNNISRIWALFIVGGTGMFISSTAFLPSSFSMMFNCLSMASWLNGQNTVAIFLTAVSSLVGWPFAALLGIPIALDLVLKGRATYFISYAALSGWAIITCLMVVDSHFYGKQTLAPFNIIMYNIFSKNGPNLYGTAPLSYYIFNCLLNWNLVFPLAILAPILSVISFQLQRGDKVWSRILPLSLIFMSLFGWLLVFFWQPHKEERFLFPIYPLLCFAAAVSLDSIKRIVNIYARGLSYIVSILTVLSLISFLLLSVSRSISLYRNYHAPFDTYMSLVEETNSLRASQLRGARTIRVCVGKEWHRFPSSFFIPPPVNGSIPVKLHFIKSEFRGLLPKEYPRVEVPAATRLVPTDQNDGNREEVGRYIPVEECHYLIDLQTPDVTIREPDYSAQSHVWEVVHSEKFLISNRSHSILRAVYIPWVSERFSFYGDYNLLRNKSLIRTSKH